MTQEFRTFTRRLTGQYQGRGGAVQRQKIQTPKSRVRSRVIRDRVTARANLTLLDKIS
jgi:hypothetical protein